MSNRIPVYFTKAELFALSEFFGDDSTMEDETYNRLGKRFLVSAAKAGLYDEIIWADE